MTKNIFASVCGYESNKSGAVVFFGPTFTPFAANEGPDSGAIINIIKVYGDMVAGTWQFRGISDYDWGRSFRRVDLTP